MENIIKSIVALVGAAISFLVGGWSPLLQVLVVFIALDYALGIMVAFAYGELSSAVGFKGIAKKVMILALVAVAYAIDTIMGDNTFTRDAVIFFYVANELISILETAGKTNLPIPKILTDAVAKLNGKADDK